MTCLLAVACIASYLPAPRAYADPAVALRASKVYAFLIGPAPIESPRRSPFNVLSGKAVLRQLKAVVPRYREEWSPWPICDPPTVLVLNGQADLHQSPNLDLASVGIVIKSILDSACAPMWTCWPNRSNRS